MANRQLSDHEFRYRTNNVWSNWVKCNVSNCIQNENGIYSIINLNYNIAIGDLQVRVRALNGNPPSIILSNTSIFTSSLVVNAGIDQEIIENNTTLIGAVYPPVGVTITETLWSLFSQPTSSIIPTITFTNITDNSLQVNWNPVANANLYILYRSLSNDVSQADEIYSGLNTNFSDSTTEGNIYFYFVKAILPSIDYSGKKIAFIGDSFTVLELYQTEVVIATSAIQIASDGVGGSTIAGGTNFANGDGQERIPMIDRIDNIISLNPDIIVLQGGANDWYHSVPLGDILSTNPNEFYGALNIIKQKCIINNILCVPIALTQTSIEKFDGSAPRYNEEELYSNAMIEVFANSNISIIDGFHNSGITIENTDIYTSDGIHPSNVAGRALYSSFVSTSIENPFTSSIGVVYAGNFELVKWDNTFISVFSQNNLSRLSGTGYGSGATANKRISSLSIGATVRIPDIEKETAYVVGLLTGILFNGGNTTFEQFTHSFQWDGVDNIRIFELGSNIASTTMPSGPVSLHIEISSSGIVTYFINDTLFYTSLNTVSLPIYIGASIYNFIFVESKDLKNVLISGTLQTF